MRYKLAVFDLDGTLVDIDSSWSWVHKHYSVNNDAALHDFLTGKIDDMEFMRRDISLWLSKKARIHISEISGLLETVPLKRNAKKLFDCLKELGIKSAIVSGGIDLLAHRVARELNIPIVVANGLETDAEGFLTGNGVLRVKLLDKGEVVKQIAMQEDVSKSEIISVGNSFIDCSMFAESDIGIAFAPVDEEVCAHATYVVNSNDMQHLKELIAEILKV
jgi:phosphoserine phosphatase